MDDNIYLVRTLLAGEMFDVTKYLSAPGAIMRYNCILEQSFLTLLPWHIYLLIDVAGQQVEIIYKFIYSRVIQFKIFQKLIEN